jgi:hypothetical protein
MVWDFLQNVANLALAFFVIRWMQIKLIEKDSEFGKALAFLFH